MLEIIGVIIACLLQICLELFMGATLTLVLDALLMTCAESVFNGKYRTDIVASLIMICNIVYIAALIANAVFKWIPVLSWIALYPAILTTSIYPWAYIYTEEERSSPANKEIEI